MEDYIQIKEKKDCVGCRACEKICPQKAIIMQEDEEGFIYPIVLDDKCVKCGICKKVCPLLNEVKKEKPLKTYAIKNKDEECARKSTSAGIAYLFSKKIIEKNGCVFGSKLNKDMTVNQIEVTNLEGLDEIRGSKYIFSDTKETFVDVKNELLKDKKVIYIGTPCQIAGLKSFLKKDFDNLYTIDFICHGVPSQKLFLKYIKYLEEKIRQSIIYYDFRNKEKKVWGNFCAKILTNNNKNVYINANSDPYYYNFLKGNTYRESCYDCKFAKKERVSDITLGDFWGIELIDSNFYDDNGVSAVLINSEKGRKLFLELVNDIEFKEVLLDDILKKNKNLERPTERKITRNNIYYGIDTLSPKKFVKKNLIIKNKVKNFIKTIIPIKIKNKIKKILK
ncbi:MAG: Coenzyme F420 hydrogenase/dehydrogenase, beta subunit C-terminal domain [Clostridia bacterium]|nr:Coenzyme F420 hydrogenase/dehydrogenase, beta subunit C-terminal domain [Clostridia bacterium]